MFNFLKRSKDTNKMGLLQRLAIKRVMSMSEEERRKLAEKAMTPENIEKNKDKILEVLEQMKASGQLTKEQAEEAKRKLNLGKDV